VAAQLLRTVSDPTTGPTTASTSYLSTSAVNNAWDTSSSFGAGEEVLHTVGALSVSGTT